MLPMSKAEAQRLAKEEGLTLVLAPGNASGYKGVSRNNASGTSPNSGYCASFCLTGKTTRLGSFTSAAEAALAYARHLAKHVLAAAAVSARAPSRPALAPAEAKARWLPLGAPRSQAAVSSVPVATLPMKRHLQVEAETLQQPAYQMQRLQAGCRPQLPSRSPLQPGCRPQQLQQPRRFPPQPQPPPQIQRPPQLQLPQLPQVPQLLSHNASPLATSSPQFFTQRPKHARTNSADTVIPAGFYSAAAEGSRHLDPSRLEPSRLDPSRAPGPMPPTPPTPHTPHTPHTLHTTHALLEQSGVGCGVVVADPYVRKQAADRERLPAPPALLGSDATHAEQPEGRERELLSVCTRFLSSAPAESRSFFSVESRSHSKASDPVGNLQSDLELELELLGCLPGEWRGFAREFGFTYHEVICLMSTADQKHDDSALGELAAELDWALEARDWPTAQQVLCVLARSEPMQAADREVLNNQLGWLAVRAARASETGREAGDEQEVGFTRRLGKAVAVKLGPFFELLSLHQTGQTEQTDPDPQSQEGGCNDCPGGAELIHPGTNEVNLVDLLDEVEHAFTAGGWRIPRQPARFNAESVMADSVISLA